MKNILSLLTISVISCGFTIGVYELVLKSDSKQNYIKEVIYKESNPNARYANNINIGPNHAYNDFDPKAVNFTNASNIGRPAVVNIQSTKSSTSEVFGGGGASGSGIIVSEDGYILTNNHVIDGAKEVKITLNDKYTYIATVIGTDPSTDLGVVKIKDNLLKGKKLPILKWDDSDEVQIGQWVLAVGNPFNLTSTVTAGIVSAKGRNIDILQGIYSVESFIQTDAVVNPGNSGGALIDAETGNLIGINTAIITRSGRYEGYSFAVPANLAKKVMNDIIEFGEVRRGFLGVTIRDIDNNMAEKYKLSNLDGVFIETATANGAAAEAGIKKGDVVIKVNNRKVTSCPELQEQVAMFRPDRDIPIEYIRDGKTYETTVKLKAKGVEESDLSKNKEAKKFKNKEKIFEDLGIEVSLVSNDELNRLKIDSGIKVSKIIENSILHKKNMEINFIIQTVNKKPVKSIEELKSLIFEATDSITLEGFYENFEGNYTYIFKKSE